jgi:aspartate/tyrosine/aromatic aminotransferase
MTKITKYLRSVEDIKKELEQNPENIKYYMGYMGYESQDENSMDFVKEKIEEYLKKEKNENTKD